MSHYYDSNFFVRFFVMMDIAMFSIALDCYVVAPPFLGRINSHSYYVKNDFLFYAFAYHPWN